MRYSLEVENIKCGGCAHIIKQRLVKKHDLNQVEIDIENGKISFSAKDHENNMEKEVLETLKSLGYPKKGSVEGLADIKAKATSFVSCAVGKINKN